jgi:hypothetical protein
VRAVARGVAPAAVLVLCLTACDPPGDTPATTATPGGTSSATAGPASRGHEVVEPGTSVTHETGRGAELQLIIGSVEVLSTCPGRGVEVEPRLGQFVVLDVTASLTGVQGAGTSDPDDAFVALTPDDFGIAAPDGRVQEIVVTEEAWACYEDPDLLPPFLDPGQTVSGKVVLESATEHGWVSYVPEGSSGWEWEF